ncbi:MAG: PAS domain S-box protein, partial [Xanthobacteraceae bacterium]|nr:PAS domain S-box protein [Xanthobacteraceae bacterium]
MVQDGATGAMSSEDRLNALEAGAVGTWRWDAAASAVHLSPRACALVGAWEAFVAYPEFLALLHPEDRAAFDRSFRAIHAPEAGWESDFRLVPQVSARWRRMRGRAGLGGAAFAGIIIDIRAPTDETIVRLAAIAAASDDAIIGTTLDGIITEWNRGAETIFGYAQSEIIGKPISILLLPDAQEEHGALFARVKNGEKIEHFETQQRRKDGALIDISLTLSPLRDAEGRLVGVSKVARDITAIKHSQSALAEREAHLQSVLDTVPDAMIVIDTQGAIQS